MLSFIKCLYFYEYLELCNLVGLIDNSEIYQSKCDGANITITGNAKIKKSTKAIMSNHNNTSDYFIDNFALKQRGCYLAHIKSLELGVFIPITFINYIRRNEIIFFNRDNCHGKLSEIIHTVCDNYRKLLIFYPEGTRNKTNKLMPLKYGVIKELYNQKKPIQIMQISNKNKILNEITFEHANGAVCNVNVSKQFHPKHYHSLLQFTDALTKEWNEMFTHL
jgi:hypothetical protein